MRNCGWTCRPRVKITGEVKKKGSYGRTSGILLPSTDSIIMDKSGGKHVLGDPSGSQQCSHGILESEFPAFPVSERVFFTQHLQNSPFV